jgi:hypothetical protein
MCYIKTDVVNEKPTYLRFCLAPCFAYTRELDSFNEISTICQFNLDLLAENKTISQVAREHNHILFR